MISAFAVNAVGADEAAVTEWVDRHLAGGRLVRARLSELVVKDSPRASEHDPRHARVLADLDGELPPIVVHEPTMRVIDGAHRVRAAQLRGDFDIAARLVQVPEADAFALAVRLNVSHGLPLMRSDRVAAAHRLLETHPFWSDRRIAVLVGMSAGTVAAYRRRSIAQSAQSAQSARSNRRIGLDGRSRPVNGAEGRLRAAQLIAERPDASLRDIARQVGVALSTVQDVRRRLREGRSPLTAKMAAKAAAAVAEGAGTSSGSGSGTESGSGTSTGSGTAAGTESGITTITAPLLRNRRRASPLSGLELASAVTQLRNDPSVRMTETGRNLLRILESERIALSMTADSIDSMPTHCARTVADVIGTYAQAWADLAGRIALLPQ